MPETRGIRKDEHLVNRNNGMQWTRKRDLVKFGSWGVVTKWQDSQTTKRKTFLDFSPKQCHCIFGEVGGALGKHSN